MTQTIYCTACNTDDRGAAVIEIRHLHYDRSVNRTFAVVACPEFASTFYVSGKVNAEQFRAWTAYTVERMRAD